MHRHHSRLIILAICLSVLAGYIDALGFLTFGGFFASFMSGNSTRLGVSLISGGVAHSILCLLIIASFVGGVVAGAVVGHASGTTRRHRVLCFVALLLLGAALLQTTPWSAAGIFLMVMAMGAENAIFQRDGDISIALTYMTGTLVRMGQRIANILYGGPRLAWLPFASLWAGFVSGAAVGTTAYTHIGLQHGLWIAAFYSLCLTPAAHYLRNHE